MSSADLEAATALKVRGNKAFAEHEWPTAIELYTQAIAKYDREPSFFSNRAQVGLRLSPGVESERVGTFGMMLTMR